MNKEEVFNLLKTKGRFYCQEKQFIKRFPDIYEDICRIDFPEDFTLIQKMYHYFMDDPELKLGICPVCGNRCKFKNLNFGYWNHCSSKCAITDENVINKIQQTNLKRYGVESTFQSNIIKDKIKKTHIENYGTEHPMKNKEYRDKQSEIMKSICNSKEYKSHIQERVQKRENTCIKKYGVKNVSALPDIREKAKQTTLERYGDVYYGKTNHYKQHQKEYTKRGFESRKKNKTYSTSKIENKLSDYFTQESILFKSQYYSDKYPYHCDFYLQDYDLYIEIQGTWTHGFHPFDVNNIDDINTLKLWNEKAKTSNFYKGAISVWTIYDVKKRETAKKNNLNYLEIFSIDFDYCINQILNRIGRGM